MMGAGDRLAREAREAATARAAADVPAPLVELVPIWGNPACQCLVCQPARYEHHTAWSRPGLPRDTARLTGRPAGIRMYGPADRLGGGEAEHWRLMFLALVARVAGVCTEDGGHAGGGDRSGVVRLGWAEVEAARALTLVEWPMVEASWDYTAYRAPEART